MIDKVAAIEAVREVFDGEQRHDGLIKA